jgi:hypothetical protein
MQGGKLWPWFGHRETEGSILAGQLARRLRPGGCARHGLLGMVALSLPRMRSGDSVHLNAAFAIFNRSGVPIAAGYFR